MARSATCGNSTPERSFKLHRRHADTVRPDNHGPTRAATFRDHRKWAGASDRTDLVLDALQAAAHTWGGRLDGAVFHSDNGTQYCSRGGDVRSAARNAWSSG